MKAIASSRLYSIHELSSWSSFWGPLYTASEICHKLLLFFTIPTAKLGTFLLRKEHLAIQGAFSKQERTNELSTVYDTYQQVAILNQYSRYMWGELQDIWSGSLQLKFQITYWEEYTAATKKYEKAIDQLDATVFSVLSKLP